MYSLYIARYTLFANMTNRERNYFFANKILLAKTRRTCCCTVFVVWRQFSHGRRFFFDKKILCVHQRDHYPTQILRTAYDKKPVRETWRTSFIHYSPYVVFSSFRFCLRIVYSGLKCSDKATHMIPHSQFPILYLPMRLWFE